MGTLDDEIQATAAITLLFVLNLAVLTRGVPLAEPGQLHRFAVY